MAKKNALRERNVLTVNAGAVARVELPIVRATKMKCYQRLSWEISLATALGNTRCRLVIQGHGYDVQVAEQQTPAANNLYWIHDAVWVYPGEVMVLLIDQPQNNTVAQLHGIGYVTEEKEGVV